MYKLVSKHSVLRFFMKLKGISTTKFSILDGVHVSGYTEEFKKMSDSRSII